MRRSSGYVAIVTVELHFPEAASLKGKRHFVRSAKDNLRNRFGASVAEVDHHDLWQRAALTVACAARSASDADELADGAERWLRGQDWQVTRLERLLVAPGDD
ncbi:MAG TPA: DUF503 domain-containing protein [Gaiellaceae bacterium]|nr:DUF503 domain-containing protein [Gaiellaceae bacterium]